MADSKKPTLHQGALLKQKVREERGQDVDILSYSQYKMWSKCEYQWYLAYHLGLSEFSQSIYTVFGTAVHEVIQEYLTTMYEETVKKANKMDLHFRLRLEMKKEYDKAVAQFKEQGYSKEQINETISQEGMVEFAKQGFEILDDFKKKRVKYFNTRETELVGIEVPVVHDSNKEQTWIGFLDVVLKYKNKEKYKIIDIKTSTKGWKKYDKSDKDKVNQLVAYKMFYADELGVDPEQIEIEYFIVKRTLYEDVDWPQSRIQTFAPASGSVTRSQLSRNLKEFQAAIRDPKKEDFKKRPDKWKCRFCDFSTQWGTGDCDQGGITFNTRNMGEWAT